MSNLGTLYIIVAPSGAGKTSLVRALLKTLDNAKVSISYTTRDKRSKEKEGACYHFVSQSEFEDKITQNDFLEYARVFGHYYGTSKDWVESELAKGIDIILEIDWQGAQQIQKCMSDCVSLFIVPPSLAVLEQRLLARGQDSNEVMAHRLEMASVEISHYAEFDYLLINDVFEKALADLQAIFKAERLKRKPQELRHGKLLENLLNNH